MAFVLQNNFYKENIPKNIPLGFLFHVLPDLEAKFANFAKQIKNVSSLIIFILFYFSVETITDVPHLPPLIGPFNLFRICLIE